MIGTLSSKNQATFPKAVREHMHIGPGSKFRFFLHPNGGIMILPVVPITRLKGSVPKLDHTLTVEEMNSAIAEEATKRYERFLEQPK